MVAFFRLLRSFLATVSLVSAYNDTECNVAATATIPSEPAYMSLRGSYDTVKTSSFRLVQYNVEWLFLRYYNGCPGSSCAWKTQPDAETHMDYVKRVIQDIQPTLMNMCEVEGCYELEKSIAWSTTGEYHPYLIFGKDTSTGQNVGMITKTIPVSPLKRNEDRVEYPVPKSTCGYTGASGTQGVSKHYYTRLRLPNGVYALLIGIHLLAYPTDKTRCAEREAQAQVIQNIVVDALKTNPGDEIIIMGDMNDFDADILDANHNTPISTVLCILKGNCGTYAGKYALRNVAEKADPTERFTDWWDSNENCASSYNEFSMIDHILVSPKLFQYIQRVTFYHEYAEFCGKYDSDHYPIIVDFAM